MLLAERNQVKKMRLIIRAIWSCVGNSGIGSSKESNAAGDILWIVAPLAADALISLPYGLFKSAARKRGFALVEADKLHLALLSVSQALW